MTEESIDRLVKENEGAAAELFDRVEQKYIMTPFIEWNKQNHDLTF